MKYLLAIVLIAAGLYAVTHSFLLVKLVGKPAWAEKYLGSGGSYFFWKLLGVAMIIVALFILRYPAWFGL